MITEERKAELTRLVRAGINESWTLDDLTPISESLQSLTAEESEYIQSVIREIARGAQGPSLWQKP